MKPDEEFKAWASEVLPHLNALEYEWALVVWLASRERTARRAAEICQQKQFKFIANVLEREFL